ncbi:MAG: ATP-dependent zinc metalloprotease FtsH [Malacoplasma sp.]
MKKRIIKFILENQYLLNDKGKMFNFFSNETNNQKTDDTTKKTNLNQPSNPKQKLDPEKKRKIIIRSIIFLFVALFLGLFIFTLVNTGPTHISVRTVTASTDGKSFIINKDQSQSLTISANTSAGFYYYGSTDIIQININGSFGYAFTMRLVTIVNNVNNIPEIYGLLGDVSINLNTGVVYKGITEDTTLKNNLGLFLKGSYGNAVVPTNNPSFFSILIQLLPLIFMIVLIVMMFKSFKGMQGGQGQESVFSIGKSQAKLAQSTVKFSDVAGIQEEKNELIEIVDYLKRPDRYAAMGARSPKGVILYGPPGTGKTLLARAVAGEAGVPFFQVSGSAFEDMLVGVGAKRVRDLFAKAVKAAPSIIFIDEIDSVGSKRGKFETTGGSLADQTLNQLLAEMDGFSTRTGVVVIAATNRLDVLDDALLRPGRFDRHIQVNLPDIKERTEILKIHAKNKNLSGAVDLEDIARRTPGFSGAQLENVLNEATLLAVRKDKTSISMSDLDEAIDRVIAGPAKRSRVISASEKKQIAYHEAGHAIVGLYTKGSDVVQKITIIPRGQAAGYTLSVPEIQELSIQKKSDLLGLVSGALGGRAAEEFIYGKESISTGAANDLFKVTNIVKSMVTQLGMSDVGMTQFIPSEGQTSQYASKFYSDKTAELIDREIERIIKFQYQHAFKIIKDNPLELDLIVEALILLETIVKPQIDYIHKYKQLPKEALEKKTELEEKKLKKEKSKATSSDDVSSKETDLKEEKDIEKRVKKETNKKENNNKK